MACLQQLLLNKAHLKNMCQVVFLCESNGHNVNGFVSLWCSKIFIVKCSGPLSLNWSWFPMCRLVRTVQYCDKWYALHSTWGCHLSCGIWCITQWHCSEVIVIPQGSSKILNWVFFFFNLYPIVAHWKTCSLFKKPYASSFSKMICKYTCI